MERFFACSACDAPMTDPAPASCPACARRVDAGDGILDFVTEPSGERDYYEAEYASAPSAEQRADLYAPWRSPYYPMNKAVLEAVGDLGGKNVLLVGNGTSRKELFFLSKNPALLVFSDYSAAAVRIVRDSYPPDERLRFAAIDAMKLPFVNASLDLVYGYAFVHHLADPEVFLCETARVLRSGGRAVFMDNRRAPLYQKAKLTVLRPLMRYYHRKGGISPEDMRATMTGWFGEPELAQRLQRLDVEPFFHRSLLVHYLFTRASERLPPQRLFAAYRRSERAQRGLIRLDDWLERFGTVRENQIRLVWGFRKP